MDEVLSAYFQSMLSHFHGSKPPPRQLLKIKFEELIINMLLNDKNKQLADYLYEVCTRDKISIREVMEENFTHNMKLKEFARLCGRSRSTFHRDFKMIYDTTPGKWLTQKRLEYSKYLLNVDDKTVSEVAFESGFKSSSHFIRIFKNSYGVTPLQFKKQ